MESSPPVRSHNPNPPIPVFAVTRRKRGVRIEEVATTPIGRASWETMGTRGSPWSSPAIGHETICDSALDLRLCLSLPSRMQKGQEAGVLPNRLTDDPRRHSTGHRY